MTKRSPTSLLLAGFTAALLALALVFLLKGHSPAYGAAITVDGLLDDAYGSPLATDPAGDLADPGPGGWDGTWWTDAISLYVTNDTQNLYVFVPLPAYSHTQSSGSFGLVVASGQYTATGGTPPTDPWGNNITFAYTATHANVGTTPITLPYRIIPDGIVRGNIVGSGVGGDDNGWTELRTWNGTDYGTGGGTDWGGIGNTGMMVGERIAFADYSGVEFSIPFADLGLSYTPGTPVHLQFYATQTGGSKGAYDTVPDDDQSADWNDPTTQHFLATYALIISQDVVLTTPAEDQHFVRPVITVTGYVTPTGQVTLTLALNSTQTFTPTLNAQGCFTQPLTLSPGANTLTATAVSALGVGFDVRHVTYGPAFTLTTPAEGQHILAPDPIPVAGVAQPAEDVTVTMQLDDDAPQGAPVDPATGVFSTTITPATNGAHTITVRALNGSGVISDVRHVTYGAAGHDDDVWWGCLGHFTRDETYREPWGAIPTTTTVTLRLRACAGDLTGAVLHVYLHGRGEVATLPMTVSTVVTATAYDYWEATAAAPITPTLMYYKFEAIDGSDHDWYVDDVAYDGRNGWGHAVDENPTYDAFRITVYHPDFHTPDWMKDAVVYQVFPDRFRDGDPANNVVSGTHFMYDNPTGGITYTTWNAAVIDPRDPTSPFHNRWSEDFYGGDLPGVTERLDYLQDMGVTAVYLNPIFRSPSNHKYDTTTFEEVDPAFGGDAALADLLAAAQARGMHVILDGVFNHTSSDSVYFDRYSRYPGDGAYESTSSPYYDWYTFDVWPDDYDCWWGYESLPILNSSNPEVRAYIYSGTNPIAVRWVLSGTAGWRLDVGGDVDSGAMELGGNDYWEGFREAVRGANPDGVIIGEEWGDATPWLLGEEWDSVMNYRFRSALLSFLRDTPYTDNDNNPSSSGGPLNPIAVSQFDQWLHGIQEDYPPEAWYAMLNLAGSHDTNRVRFVLGHAQHSNGSDLTPAELDARQGLLALLQFTLPGAPTIYYGDETGVDAPGAWYNDKWEDDPYNRVPFPWDDTPGHYTARPDVQALYARLARIRNDHPALRTGTFDTLLTDDDRAVYAFGRTLGVTETAVVVINRGATAHTVTLPLAGYVPDGTLLTDYLNHTQYVVGEGAITLMVPGEWGAILSTVSEQVYLPLVMRNFDPGNLLLNPGFEGITQPGGWTRDTFNGVPYGEIFTPEGWIAWWEEGNGWGRPEMKVIPFAPPFVDPPRVRSGDYGAMLFTFYRRHNAGYYQTVEGLSPEATVTFSAYAHAWSCDDDDHGPYSCGDPDNIGFRVGVDSDGGIDPWSADVVWSKRAPAPDTFRPIGPVTAQVGPAGRVTVFLRSDTLWPYKHNDAYWDDANLAIQSP